MSEIVATDGAVKTRVLISGAGPVGLTIANILGVAGVETLVVEKLDALIDYPRAIGLDDEALRTFQSIGVADRIEPHTTPFHWMRFMTSKGRCWASIEPKTDEFGWSRRNAFIQPQADAILFEALGRFPHVKVMFSSSLADFTQTGDKVVARVQGPNGVTEIEADFLVAADGGRSPVREKLGLTFDGATAPNQWIVVDVADDPVGTPNIYLVCDSERPYVSAALPHGIRRFEFMVMPGETEEYLTRPDVMRGLLAKVVADPDQIRLIRQRQYSHNSRLASRFRVGRVMLAGDAAHIMPVWQGQGYNSGIRDAANLGWKLAAVAQGKFTPALLDTYETERRAHAKAMIDLSVTAGKIFNPPKAWMGTVRDALTLVLNRIPAVKRYVLEMRFKPMPRFDAGAIVAKPRKGRASPIGRLFIQPRVTTVDGRIVRMDEVIGPNFAIVSWGIDPRLYLSETEIERWTELGAVFVRVLPEVQLATETAGAAGLVTVGDAQGRLKEWFGGEDDSIVFLRPDRVVGAMSGPQKVTETSRAFLRALSFPGV